MRREGEKKRHSFVISLLWPDTRLGSKAKFKDLTRKGLNLVECLSQPEVRHNFGTRVLSFYVSQGLTNSVASSAG